VLADFDAPGLGFFAGASRFGGADFVGGSVAVAQAQFRDRAGSLIAVVCKIAAR
jgi:hypothetical protein